MIMPCFIIGRISLTFMYTAAELQKYKSDREICLHDRTLAFLVLATRYRIPKCHTTYGRKQVQDGSFTVLIRVVQLTALG